MSRLSRLLAALASTLVCATSAQAAPLTVTEATDFFTRQPLTPLPIGNHDTELGLLDVGVNTISGRVSGARYIADPQGFQPTNIFSGDYSDRFSVQLAAGQRIVGWMLTISGFSFGNDGISDVGGSYSGPGGPLAISTNLSPVSTTALMLDTPGFFDIEIVSPFSFIPAGTACTITPSGSFCGDSPAEAFAGQMSYTVVLQVESTSVPEPSTLLLAGFAIGLAGLARRRRAA